VYSHDQNGNPTFGDIGVLIGAIRNGNKVRMCIEFQSAVGQEYFTDAETIWVKNNIVYAQNTTHVSTKFHGNVLRFQDNAYHWFIIVDTKGNIDMSRWNVGEHKVRGHTQDKVKIKWYVV
jgi:hypothetical protein